jgi:hypothetical protein
MLRLPSSLAAVYRPATDREVCSWSFGAVKAPRDPGATTWQARRGTLDDQAIFGPLRDFRCACGKYEGNRHRSMICDLCGVKVTTREARRQRFGHMNLPVAVPHPLGEGGERLSAVPVLPAAFWQAPAGGQLAQRYDELARATTEQLLTAGVASLIELMLPVVTLAHDWNLAEGQTLARGLALERREGGG